ncbi:hypothetical protein OK006_9555 [Actinobacteria bacterium OK006]|nr:hypothetical protein OK006_9555 [Actinobacteria bacterium OK006]
MRAAAGGGGRRAMGVPPARAKPRARGSQRPTTTPLGAPPARRAWGRACQTSRLRHDPPDRPWRVVAPVGLRRARAAGLQACRLAGLRACGLAGLRACGLAGLRACGSGSGQGGAATAVTRRSSSDPPVRPSCKSPYRTDAPAQASAPRGEAGRDGAAPRRWVGEPVRAVVTAAEHTGRFVRPGMALGTTAAPAPRPADPGRAADPGGPRTRSAVRHGRAALENLRPKDAHAGGRCRVCRGGPARARAERTVRSGAAARNRRPCRGAPRDGRGGRGRCGTDDTAVLLLRSPRGRAPSHTPRPGPDSIRPMDHLLVQARGGALLSAKQVRQTSVKSRHEAA